MRPKNTGKADPRKILLPKEELYQKYIVENLSRKACAEYFNVTEKIIILRVGEYGFKKDVRAIKRNRKLGVIAKYGVDSAFKLEEIRQKAKKTMLERYGVEYTAQSPVLQEKMQNTIMNKYHKKNFVETTEFKKKSQQTCNKKQGVNWPCQFDKCREALEKAAGCSKPEQQFIDVLNKYNVEYEREFPIRGFKYDFKVGNFLFEINPSVTHNVNFGVFGNQPKHKMYHYIKYSVAKEFGYRCIHIFDWDDKEKIIKTFLVNKKRVYARDCAVKKVSISEARVYLNENHLQGYAKDEIRLGLYLGSELVEIMTFDKPRYNKNYEWELIRLCSSANVIGGTEKLLSHFEKEYNPKNIISYCDLSKFDGNIYSKLGFEIVNKPKPSAHWVNLTTGQHITDNLLRQKGFDQLFKTNYGKGTSNEELMLENGFVKVYDCGQLTFVKLIQNII